jgi:hypothetical protein
MMRVSAIAGATLLVLLLTACDPAAPGPTESPGAGSPVASPSATAASASPEPRALVLPECSDLYTADQITTLMNEFVQLNAPEDSGPGTRFEDLRALLDSAGSLNCTWVLPGSEFGVSVSIVASSDAIETAVAATLSAAGSSGTGTGGDSVIYSIEVEETPEQSGFLETHYLAGGVWVCVNGGQSPALAQAAMQRVAELNP